MSQLCMVASEVSYDIIIEVGANPANNCFINSIFDSIKIGSSNNKNFETGKMGNENRVVTESFSQNEIYLWLEGKLLVSYIKSFIINQY